MKKGILATSLIVGSWLSLVNPAAAADYIIDTDGAHASVQFKIQHLGYSWLWGRFNQFDGSFSYDAKSPDTSAISVNIATNSLDSNHAERDKHLRSDDFLEVKAYPQASFTSQNIKFSDADNAVVTGPFILKGVTKTISFLVVKVGEGADPWGGYRVGFSGETRLKLSDYNITTDLGPASTYVDIILNIEGIHQ